jgi:hypothetical protein
MPTSTSGGRCSRVSPRRSGARSTPRSSTAPTSRRRGRRRIIPAAIAAGNVYERGTNAAGAGGISADVNGLFSTVEADGFVVDGLVTQGTYKGLLRNARDANGVLLSEVSGGTIYGVPIKYAMTGLWPAAATAEAIAGDFTQGILGIRQDLTYKLLDQAVITDDTGS